MLAALLIALMLAGLSGLWLWLSWRKKPTTELSGLQVGLHGVAAAAVLISLVLTLDNHGQLDGWRLLAVFLAISTGMLLFLKRQRQRLFPNRLMALHILFGLIALGIVAAAWLA